jgi:L-iditol 2-dehydrogenase
VADSLGAEVVVSGLDRDAAHRLPLAADLGLATANVEAGEDPAAAVPGVDRRGGFDVVVDATGAHAGVADAAGQVRRGGQVVVVGVPSDPGEVAFAPLVRGEVDVTTSYGATWTDFERALGLLAAGDVDVDALVEDASVADPAATFESFLAAETCKPLFRFAD